MVHIITGRNFNGLTQGVAYIGTLCSQVAGVGTTNLVYDGMGQISVAATAAVIAHELGHNFGANHDGIEEALSCSSSEFVMSAVLTSELPSAFSVCSENTITQSMANVMGNSCATAPIDINITNGNNLSMDVEIGQSLKIEDAFLVSIGTRSFRTEGEMNVMITAEGAIINSVTISEQPCIINDNRSICPFSVDSNEQHKWIQKSANSTACMDE